MTHGQVIQVNVSRGGVPKRPVESAQAGPLGIAGDLCANPHVHGGPQKALLLVASEVIQELTARGYPLFHGALGENLTTAGLDHRAWRAGQRYRVGSEVIIELTKPRGPCRTLDVYGEQLKLDIYDDAVKAGDVSSPVWGMSGFYAAVITGGAIHAGAPVLLVDESC